MAAETVMTYHAVILTHTGEFTTESFVTREELAARLKELIDKDISVSCFVGQRVHISKPPYRYLMTPEGNIALFSVPDAPEPDETGYLGVDPAHLEEPPQIQMPPVAAQQSDEFFSDVTSDLRNVFDDALPDPDA